MDKETLDILKALLEPINSKLDKMQAEIDEIKQYELGTRTIIESKVVPQIQTVAEQHGEIVGRLKRLEARHETSQALRSHVKTLEDVVRTHTERIEEIEAKIG